MSDIKVIILCNNPIALPGIKEFLFFGKVGALVTTKRNVEMQELLGQFAEGTGVPVITVEKKNYTQVLEAAIVEHHITAGLIMTFPYILPKAIVDLPPKGFINFHYGLLPQCRGPQPILWHLLNNDAEAGITLHRLDEGIDTGPVIMQERVPILPNDTYGLLQGKLAHAGAKCAATLLKILSFGSTIPTTQQDESKAAYYEKPTAKDLTLSWKTMNSDLIVRIVNACNPWNKAAASIIQKWVFGITEAELTDIPAPKESAPGTIIALDSTNGFLVQAADNKIVRVNIIYLQEGFFSGWRLAGFGIKPGNTLE